MKISQKGQVTLPKEIRIKLNTDFIYFEMKNDIITIKPFRDASGSLREFARNVKQSRPKKQLKDKAWQIAIRDKIGKKSV